MMEGSEETVSVLDHDSLVAVMYVTESSFGVGVYYHVLVSRCQMSSVRAV